MIKFLEAESGAMLGEISEVQLKFFQDHLEEEDSTDHDYYINQTTIDMFESAGADPALITLLRRALGTREDMDIRWERS